MKIQKKILLYFLSAITLQLRFGIISRLLASAISEMLYEWCVYPNSILCAIISKYNLLHLIKIRIKFSKKLLYRSRSPLKFMITIIICGSWSDFCMAAARAVLPASRSLWGGRKRYNLCILICIHDRPPIWLQPVNVASFIHTLGEY